MNAAQFRKAFAIANDETRDLSQVDDTHLHGCALPEFGEIQTTIEPVAKMLHHVGMQLNGQWDMQAVNDFRDLARRKFRILD